MTYFRNLSASVILFAVFILTAGISQAYAELDVSCIGPNDAKHFVVYLHGMDFSGPNFTPVELYHRTLLEQLANELSLRIALPRGPKNCSSAEMPNAVCWGRILNEDELAEVIPQILQSRTVCFPESVPFSAIGYSNGGYFLSKWLLSANLSQSDSAPNRIITIGSGKLYLRKQYRSYHSKQPNFFILVGNQDPFNSHSKPEVLTGTLNSVGIQTKYTVFEGAHHMTYESLKAALIEILH